MLTRLVDKSLVVAEIGDATRYRLLETVRAFALERAGEEAQLEAAARRHRDHYLSLAEELAAHMLGPDLGDWLRRGALEDGNLLAALRWSLEADDPDTTLELASALAYYWYRTSYLIDGRPLLARALDAAGPDSRWWPRGLIARAWLDVAARASDAVEHAREAVDATEADEAELNGLALAALASAQLLTGSSNKAAEAAERAMRIFADLGHAEGAATAEQLIGVALYRRGELDRAFTRAPRKSRCRVDARSARRGRPHEGRRRGGKELCDRCSDGLPNAGRSAGTCCRVRLPRTV